MKRNPTVTLTATFFGVAAAEIAFHWLLGRDIFPTILSAYLSPDYPSRKQLFEGIVDSLVPAAVLGWTAGWVGFCRWSLRAVAIAAVSLATLTVAMQPSYGYLIGWNRFFVGARDPKSAFLHWPYLYDIFTTSLVCLLFAYASYRGRHELARTKSQSAPQ